MTDQDKKKRVNLSLDKQTLDSLAEISEFNSYGSISSAIRIMVKRYGRNELKRDFKQSKNDLMEESTY